MLETRLGPRSADILSWWREQPDPSASMLYMEEEFSPARFGCAVFLLFSLAVIGGSVFVSYRGNETSTQSWLAVVQLVFAVLLFGLTPCITRRL